MSNRRITLNQGSGVSDAYPQLWESRHLLLLGAAILVISFWQALANFYPTADNEQLPKDVVPVILQQGRIFSFLLLKLLAPKFAIHPLDLLIAIVAFAASIAITVRTWAPGSRPEHYAAVLVAAAFPTTVHMFTFSTVNMVCGLATLLSALSVWCFVNKRHVWFCAFTVIAVGMYQGVLLNAVVGYIFYLVIQLTDDETPIENMIREGLLFIGLLALSSLLYSTLLWIILAAAGEKLRYVQDMLRPELLLGGRAGRIISAAFEFLYDVMRGRANLFLDRGRLIGTLQLGLLAAAFINCFRRSGTTTRGALAVLLLLVGVSATFLSIALMAAEVRYRTMLSAPIAMGGLAFVATMGQPKWLQNTLLAVSALLTFCYAQTTVQMIRSAALSWQADRELSQRIVERIQALSPPPPDGQKMGFDIVGTHTAESPWIRHLDGFNSTMGWSFYEYGESSSRAIGALSIMGYPNFRLISNAERLRIADRVLAMPIWPADGSVAVIDGIAVVKFAKRWTNHQISTSCRSLPAPQCSSILFRTHP
jgi:hypothetical protein